MADEKDSPGGQPILDAGVRRELAGAGASGILRYRSRHVPSWCPGCGYFGVAQAVVRAAAALKLDNASLVMVSSTGCAGRFPFTLDGYGFHTTRGRALPIAAGVKLANPALTVLAVSGDGDGLGIGGGHLPHACRRNVDLTYLMLDNGLASLTRGHSSPATPAGQVTASHPAGNPDRPLDPVLLALAGGASFVARGYAGDPDFLAGILAEAIRHRGFSFLTILSPCVTFDRENIVYDRLRDQWAGIPAGHDRGSRLAAMALALSGIRYQGIFFREEGRPD